MSVKKLSPQKLNGEFINAKCFVKLDPCHVTERAGCSGWIHKRCTNVKGSLARVEDAFVCKVCERADDGEVG